MNKGTFNHSLQGAYKVAVVDGKTSEIVWAMSDFEKNLILNVGMDQVNQNYYADLMKNAIAGVGTRVNSIDAGASTITQVGTNITLTPVGGGMSSFTGSAGGYTSQLQVGDVIKYSGGSTSQIAGAITDTTATAVASNAVAGETFIIWKTSQTGLQTELARGGPSTISGSDSYYLPGAGNCGYTILDDTLTLLRTYDFALETLERHYTEVGVGWSSSAAPSSTFSRILLSTPVTASAGQRLRVIYQLQVKVSPTASVSIPSATISGWPVAPATNTNASESLQLFHMITILPSGNTQGVGALEPGDATAYVWLSSNSSSLQPFGAPVDRTNPAADKTTSPVIKPAYVVGSYYCDKVGTFTVSQMNRTDLASCGFGRDFSDFFTTIRPYDDDGQSYAMVFNQTQSKHNTETLTLAWRWTWNRVLANG